MWLDRYAHIKQMHQNVYDFEGNYVPLGITLKSLYSINSYDLFTNYEKMFESEMKKAQAAKSIGSDIVPCVVLRFDPVLIPSMLGGTVINVGERPWVEPWMSIDDAKKLEVPPMDSGIMPMVERAIEYFIKNTPEDIVICTPPEPFPFEIAVAMIGSRLYYDVYDQPELVSQILEVITSTFIEVEKHIKALLKEPLKEKVSYLGTYMPGVRMACDSIVNLSPAMVRSYLYPVFKEIRNTFGRVLVHYCPTPTNKHYYVLDPILQCPDVLGIDTSGGIQYFDDKDNPYRMKEFVTYVADCPFINEQDAMQEDEVDPLKNIMKLNKISWNGINEWLETDFMKLSIDNRRGTILRSQVDSIEEGKELHALWREHFPARQGK